MYYLIFKELESRNKCLKCMYCHTKLSGGFDPIYVASSNISETN